MKNGALFVFDFQDEDESLGCVKIGGATALDFTLTKFKQATMFQWDIYIVCAKQMRSCFVNWALSRGVPTGNVIPYDNARGFLGNLRELIALTEIDGKTLHRMVACSSSIRWDSCLDLGSIVESSCTETSCTTLYSSSQPIRLPFICFQSISCLSGLVESNIGAVGDEFLEVIEKNSGLPTNNALNSSSIQKFSACQLWLTSEMTRIQTIFAGLPDVVTASCPARVGLLGNPSDGFCGKTLSFLVDNFSAQVSISRATSSPNKIEIIPHPLHDQLHFDGMDGLVHSIITQGYYGGTRLIAATCRKFADCCSRAGLVIQWLRPFSIQITYDTNIPRRVGLSGSSAIVVSTFAALLKLHRIDIGMLGITLYELPGIILDAERIELGINAGLQDRVVQVFGGLVHMDFSTTATPGSQYQRADASLLPCLYLAFDTTCGSDSGQVHSTVKERWLKGDVRVVEGMRELGDLTDAGLVRLAGKEWKEFGALLERNFFLRRCMYGEEVIGARNISAHDLANTLGFCAKFTGSGGAFVCFDPLNPYGLTREDEEVIRQSFHAMDFEFIRLHVSSNSNFI